MIDDDNDYDGCHIYNHCLAYFGKSGNPIVYMFLKNSITSLLHKFTWNFRIYKCLSKLYVLAAHSIMNFSKPRAEIHC